jgi:hypothetical protein
MNVSEENRLPSCQPTKKTFQVTSSIADTAPILIRRHRFFIGPDVAANQGRETRAVPSVAIEDFCIRAEIADSRCGKIATQSVVELERPRRREHRHAWRILRQTANAVNRVEKRNARQ